VAGKSDSYKSTPVALHNQHNGAGIILTVGHSTHPIEDFLKLLAAHAVELLIDIRTIPKSRRNPQYNSDSLAQALERAGIEYRHMPGLGGLRHPRKDSINTAWQNSGFRGYADYMQTPQFESSLHQLIQVADRQRTVIMCAEAVPWRCHRSLVADALMARGVTVEHILSGKSAKAHTCTAFARVEGHQVTYPGLILFDQNLGA
jgi:uncharacterized protein (DUF488 family)